MVLVHVAEGFFDGRSSLKLQVNLGGLVIMLTKR